MIQYKLGFYFYVFEGWENNRAIQLHLQCLKHYSHLFDNAYFVLSIDDITREDLLTPVKRAIVDCGFTNIKFKVWKNDPLCEVVPFYEELLPWGNKNETLFFFGHTKGVTNYIKYPQESIDNWILGLYYLSLEFPEEKDDLLLRDWSFLFYGPFLLTTPEEWKINKYNINYSGTFFWVNVPKLYSMEAYWYIERNTRHSVEFLPGNMGYFDVLQTPQTGLASHHLLVGYGKTFDIYYNPLGYMFFLDEQEQNDFLKYKYTILSAIKNENN